MGVTSIALNDRLQAHAGCHAYVRRVKLARPSHTRSSRHDHLHIATPPVHVPCSKGLELVLQPARAIAIPRFPQRSNELQTTKPSFKIVWPARPWTVRGQAEAEAVTSLLIDVHLAWHIGRFQRAKHVEAVSHRNS
jgi:hypothetical protein